MPHFLVNQPHREGYDRSAGAITGRLHELELETDGRPTEVPQVVVTAVSDGSFRFAVANGSAVQVWDGLTGDLVRTFSLPDTRRSSGALAALKDHRVVIAASGGGWTVVWDAESGDELAKLTDGGDGYRHAVEMVNAGRRGSHAGRRRGRRHTREHLPAPPLTLPVRDLRQSPARDMNK